mmetsp:Transcript_31566/g.27961  ORF Transcript_31566/g.27961 Transcript_31566/m.27961 type:complete len:116 (+) Transcript_31566:526-873(+)
MYFYTYETLTRHFIRPDDSSKRKYTIKVLAGGMAGVMDWVPTYPLDVVKTKIQTNPSKKTPSVIEVIKKYYRLQGIKFFFKGIVPTCALAFPMNAMIFIIYDEIIEALNKDELQE